LHKINFGSIRKYDYILTFSAASEKFSNEKMRDVYLSYLKYHNLLNVISRESGKILDYTFNIKFLSEDDIEKKVEEKLELLGIIKEGKLFPCVLSYNKRRLAGIARAIIMDPEILIFDEPAAGLDPVGYRTVIAFIKKLKNDLRKTMLITVNSATGAMAFGDRVGIIKDGRFILSGKTEDLKKSEDPYVKGLFF